MLHYHFKAYTVKQVPWQHPATPIDVCTKAKESHMEDQHFTYSDSQNSSIECSQAPNCSYID